MFLFAHYHHNSAIEKEETAVDFMARLTCFTPQTFQTAISLSLDTVKKYFSPLFLYY